jgi:ribose 5-phosphate isomerase A
VQALLEGVSCGHALGSLDDNDDEADDEEEEDEEEDEEEEGEVVNLGECDGAEDDLVAALSALRVANPPLPPPAGAAAVTAAAPPAGTAAAGGTSAEDLKRLVGYKAVDDFVKSGMVVGLGTGSTAFFAVERLGQKLSQGLLSDVSCVPTSERTKHQAQSLGIPLLTLDDLVGKKKAAGAVVVDVAIDGADSVEPPVKSGAKAVLVKGGGGALLREKMVEASAATFVCIVDASKVCPGNLGPHFMVPVEVVPFCHAFTAEKIAALPSVVAAGGEALLRRGSCANNAEEPEAPLAVTDNGNHIVDLRFAKPLSNPAVVASELSGVVGVVEHGLFVDMADAVLVANSDGTISTLTN